VQLVGVGSIKTEAKSNRGKRVTMAAVDIGSLVN
jgi:hypothetical protein